MSNNIAFAGIGFLIGGIVGGLLAGCWLGKEYKKTIDRLQADISRLESKRDEKAHEEYEKRKEKADKEIKEINERLGYSLASDDSGNDNEEFDSDDDIDFEDPFTDTDEASEDEADKDIHMIDRETFDEDLPYREHERVTFYQQDGILADEYDEPILNSADIIGMEAIEEAEKTELEYLYVDNGFEDKLYEIEVNHLESFYRDVER